MAIDMLKRSIEILTKATWETGKNYMTNVTDLVQDAATIRDNVAKGYGTVVNVYKNMKQGPGPLKKLSDWFYSRGEQYGDFDDDDQFDAGFGTGDSGDESSASAVLDKNSMRDIVRGQVGAMYQIGGKQAEVATANTAEIITSLNSRTSEITASINNMNKTLLEISKRLESVSNVIAAKAEKEERMIANSAVDYNGRIKLDQVFGRIWQRGVRDSTPVSMASMLIPMIAQGGPVEAASMLMSMFLTNKEWTTSSGNKWSIDKIGEKINDTLGNLVENAITKAISSKPFQKIFGDDVIKNSEMGGNYARYYKSSYDTNRAIFDNMTRTSIVDVIPSYLREITKALTGQNFQINSRGQLTTNLDNEFIAHATSGIFSKSGMTGKSHDKIVKQFKDTYGDDALTYSQLRTIEKTLVDAYTWIYFENGYDMVKSDDVGSLLYYKDEAKEFALNLLKAAFGNNQVFNSKYAQIEQALNQIIMEASMDNTWSAEQNTLRKAIQAQVRSFHAKAVEAAQDQRTGKQARRIKRQDFAQAQVKKSREYSPFDDGSLQYTGNALDQRKKDQKLVNDFDNNKHKGSFLHPETQDVKEARERLRSDNYAREAKETFLPEKTQSLLEKIGSGNPHLEDIGVNILKKLHNVIRVKIVGDNFRVGRYFPKWMTNPPADDATPSNGGTPDGSSGGATPPTPSPVQPLAGASTPEAELSGLLDDGINGTKSGIAAMQNGLSNYIATSDPNSVTNKLARLLVNDGATADRLTGKIDRFGTKASGAISKVGTAIRTRGGSILEGIKDEAHNLWDDAKTATHSLLDRKLEEREIKQARNQQIEALKGVAARDTSISDKDKEQANIALGMMQTAPVDGNTKHDLRKIEQVIRKIKDPELRQSMSDAVKGMLDQNTSEKEDQPAKSKLGKILKWALGGLGVVFAPIIKVIKNIGKGLLKGLNFVRKFFTGALKQAGSALKQLGKNFVSRMKWIGEKLQPVVDFTKKIGGIFVKGIKGFASTVWGLYKKGMKTVAGAITGVFKKVGNLFGLGADKLEGALSGSPGKKEGKITKGLKNFGKGFMSTFTHLGNEKEKDPQEKVAEKTEVVSEALTDTSKANETNNVILKGCSTIVEAIRELMHQNEAKEETSELIEEGTDKAGEAVGDAVDDAADKASEKAGEAAAKAGEKAGEAAAKAGEAAGEAAAESADDVAEGAASGGSPIGALIGVAAKILLSIGAFKELMSALMGSVQEVLKPIGETLLGLMDVVKPVLSMLSDVIGDLLEPIKEVLTICIDILKPFLSAVGGAISKIVSELMEVISPILTGVANTLKVVMGIIALGSGLILKVGSLVGTAVGALAKVLTFGLVNTTAIWQGMSNLADGLVTYGKQNFKEGISGIVASVSDLVSAFQPAEQEAVQERQERKERGEEKMPTGSIMDGLYGSGDTYNFVYRNMYGSGNTTQYSYGGYMNMGERGCGPVALADAYSRRTGGRLNAASLAAAMAGSGNYDAARGTSVGGYMNASRALGMNLTAGGVTAGSLRHASPNNPITVIGSGTGFGTRGGNTHYMNVVGTDRNGLAYVSNPMNGRVSRVPTSAVVGNSLLGLYGSGDSDGGILSKFKLPDGVSDAFSMLKELASGFLSFFTGESAADKQQREADEAAKEKQLRQRLGASVYDALESDARALFEKEYPRDANESAVSYDRRWNNKRRSLMIRLASEKLQEETKNNPSMQVDMFDELEKSIADKTGYSLSDMGDEYFSSTTSDALDQTASSWGGMVDSYTNSSDSYGMKSNFTPRLTKPEYGNKYYNTTSNGGYSNAITGKPMQEGLNVLANCSGYALGRINESVGDTSFSHIRPTGSRNGDQFIKRAAEQGWEIDYTGNNPMPGDIISWSEAGHSGHVAVVEQVPDPNTIIISHSGYDSNLIWETKKLTKENSNNPWPIWKSDKHPPYVFLGFAHNPDIEYYVDKPGSYLSADASDQQIFTYLVHKNGMTPIGAAGLMGIFENESGMQSDNLQDTFQRDWGYPDGKVGDRQYTDEVNSGAESMDAFVGSRGTGSAGYGLTQFTSSNLKQDLYNKTVKQGYSIDNASAQLDILTGHLKQRTVTGLDKYKGKTLFQAINSATTPTEANKLFFWQYAAGTSFTSDAGVLKKYKRKGMTQKGIDKRHADAERFYELYGKTATYMTDADVTANFNGKAGASNAVSEKQKAMLSNADGNWEDLVISYTAGQPIVALNKSGEYLFNAWGADNPMFANGNAWNDMVKSLQSRGAVTFKNGNTTYVAFDFDDSAPSQKALELIKNQQYSPSKPISIISAEERPDLMEIIANADASMNQYHTEQKIRADMEWLNKTGFDPNKVTTKRVENGSFYKGGAGGVSVYQGGLLPDIEGSGDTPIFDSSYIPPINYDGINDYFTSTEGLRTPQSINNITVVRDTGNAKRDYITMLLNNTYNVRSESMEEILKQILTELQTRKSGGTSSTNKPTSQMFDDSIPAQIQRLTKG